jgi:hypothetical protein
VQGTCGETCGIIEIIGIDVAGSRREANVARKKEPGPFVEVYEASVYVYESLV